MEWKEASFFTLDIGLRTLRVMFTFNGRGLFVMGTAFEGGRKRGRPPIRKWVSARFRSFPCVVCSWLSIVFVILCFFMVSK
jgi:hypothetical protein